MGYTARWGPKGFIVSSSKVVPLEDFKTSFALKSDTNSDTSGTPPTNTRGMELQTLELSTRYLRALGTDPIGQIAEWKAQVGKSYPFILGGKQFGPKFTLKSFDVSDTMFTPAGVMIGCTISLKFEEYSTATTTNASASKNTNVKTKLSQALTSKPTTSSKSSKKSSSKSAKKK